MTVAMIVLIIALGIGIYLGVQAFDRYSYQCYRYRFITIPHLMLVGISEAMLGFGNRWHETALKTGGDILNGQILMVLGFVGLIMMFKINLKASSLGIAFVGLCLQLFIGAFWVVAALFMIIAALQVKPTYCINGRDW